MTEEKRPEGGDPERTEPMGRADSESTQPMGRDWSRYQDPQHESRERERAAHDAARDAERIARDAERVTRDQERMARERERMAREQERMTREQQREQERAQREQERRAERERERAERHADRARRREEWRSRRVHVHGFDLGDMDFDPGDFAKNFMKDFVSDASGDAYTETASGEFSFATMPRLRVRNISGETRIRVGDPNKITVVATKRVNASSEDRAKRLLQNLEIRMEKNGDELRVEPHLYEQERSWVELFRGKRFRVDFDITVPRETTVDAQTVNGDLSVNGVRGPHEIQAVSGDVTIEDVQGPLRLKSVSGDIGVRRYVGHVEGNSVSGDIMFDTARIRSLQLQTVSGDILVKGVLEPARAHRFKTISGDIDLSLADPDLLVEFRTASGDLECDIPARVNRQSRKEYTVALGEARGHSVVKTVSGDLTVRGTVIEVPGEPTTEPPAPRPEFAAGYRSEDEELENAFAGVPEPPIPPEPPVPPVDPRRREELRTLLDKLAKGELSVDDAAAEIDARRKGG